MTTQELIQKANENALERRNIYRKLISENGLQNGVREWNKISYKYSDYAVFNNVVCESTCCISEKGKVYFQNRFYLIKTNGKRTTFSKAKAILLLG